MKNLFKKTNVILASAIVVVVLGTFAGAFPAQAHAQGGYYWAGANNGSPYKVSYCVYPQVATVYTNGQYVCGYPTPAPQPPVYQPPVYQPPVYQPPVYQPPVYQPPVYQPPVYQQPVIQYPNLTASCYANNSNNSVQTGTSVQWTAYASGGTGAYTYSWSGTDGFYGSGQTVYFTYNNPGTKTVNLTVYSNGQTITVNCSSITVYQSYAYNQQPYYNYSYQAPVVQQYAYAPSSNNSGLDIGCYANPVNAAPDQPVTWSVEVTGGAAPYTYSWTGSEGLAGSQSTILKYYSTTGDKSAIVTVTSADGRTATMACSNSLAVRSTRSTLAVATPVAQPVAQPAAQNNQLGANALFSLGNVPWGWVAVLVILVLIASVAYLLFNRPKI